MKEIPKPSPEDAALVASQCVDYITEFIDVLRDTFSPPSEKGMGGERLFASVAEHSMAKKVAKIHTKALQFHGPNDTIHQFPWVPYPPPEIYCDATELPFFQRCHLLFYILLPLLASLGQFYEFLDQNIDAIPPQPRERNRKPPPPPLGLLSLKNYTDIACLVEFIVCTSILPIFPPNVLKPIQDRVRYQLPKSMAGRLPSSSLLWGTSIPSPSSEQFEEEYETVVCVLGRFLLLDRFRHSILPRHVCDILAVVVYLNTHGNNSSPKVRSSSYAFVVERWMGVARVTSKSSPLLDSYSLAKAYQRLLWKGRDAPGWLRLAISQRLTKLATHHLLDVIAVFVQESVDGNYSAAALRLARAIVSQNSTEPDEKDEYFCAICDQLLVVLDSMSRGHPSKMEFVPRIETVWAILNLLPKHYITGYFFETIVQKEIIQSNGVDDNALFCSNITRIVSRFRTLLLCNPSTANNSIAAQICSLLFKPLMLSELNARNCPDQPSGLTVIGALVRLAATPCVEKCALKNDVVLMLRSFVSLLTRIEFINESETVPGMDVLIVALLQSLAPCIWDDEFLTFDLSAQNDASKAHCQPLLIRKVPQNDLPMISALSEGLEKRANFIFRQLLMLEISQDDDFTTYNHVLCLFFQALLTLYFSAQPLNSETKSSMLLSNDRFRFVSMTCIPLICDVFSPELLLSSNCDSGIFDVFKIILECAVARFSHMDDFKSSSGNTLGAMAHRLLNAEKCVWSHFRENSINETFCNDGIDGPDIEMILSVTAIVLGLLVSILELGAKVRSAQDELVLQSFAPGLMRLANSDVSFPNMDASLMSAHAQVAEMASLAAALVASRLVVRNFDCNLKCEDNLSTDSEYMTEAENALRSDLPPLRARGMVLLRNRANAISEEKKRCENIDDFEGNREEVFKILLLSVEALKDSESYVYLAAIHTIVSVVDVNPSIMVPILGIAVASGEIDLDVVGKIRLCLEQRTKLTEALVFIIRRSNSFHEQLPLLIRLLVVGLKSELEPSMTNEETLFIQVSTHQYFVTDTVNNVDKNSREEYWKEVDLRVRTGGPIFKTEEGDLVRSAMVMVVSELLAVLSPSVTARYSSLLVDCSIDMLRLEASRPVRRAGASLTRELYGALVREQVELMEAIASDKPFDVRFSRAILEGRETVLFCILEDIVAHRILEDPATIARSREALELRQAASEGGILLAGKASLQSKRQLDENPIVRLLNNQSHPSKTQSLVKIIEEI